MRRLVPTLRMRRLVPILAGATLALSGMAADLTPSKNAGPYVPSPESVVSDMLRLAEVGPDDFIVDLGSGDGRIVLTAAKVFGAKGFGVEIKDDLVRYANEAARREGLADRVRFLKQDLFKTDISAATVLTMYLLPDTVNLLRDKLLAELRPGARVVSHDYPLSGWMPETFREMELEDKVEVTGVPTTLVYLYVVPAKVAGSWKAMLPATLTRRPASLELTQQFTKVGGTARLEGRELPLQDGKLRGDRLSFRLAGLQGEFTGRVKGRTIEGVLESKGVRRPWSARLGG